MEEGKTTQWPRGHLLRPRLSCRFAIARYRRSEVEQRGPLIRD
jgi:hypothetical protein